MLLAGSTKFCSACLFFFVGHISKGKKLSAEGWGLCLELAINIGNEQLRSVRGGPEFINIA